MAYISWLQSKKALKPRHVLQTRDGVLMVLQSVIQEFCVQVSWSDLPDYPASGNVWNTTWSYRHMSNEVEMPEECWVHCKLRGNGLQAIIGYMLKGSFMCVHPGVFGEADIVHICTALCLRRLGPIMEDSVNLTLLISLPASLMA